MASKKREASPEASPLKGPAPKAVPEDTSDVAFDEGIPLSPMAGDQTVQFISGTPANGDAKVEIGDSGGAPTFVGLGKEELMKYANDPFWIKLRWFLFILFWILWIAMLVGAIVIIVFAPRCAEKRDGSETFYQIKAADLIKDGKIEEHTKGLKDLGVKTIIIADVLMHDTNEPEAVTDFHKMDETIEAGLFAEAIDALKSHGLKILLQIVPNHAGTSHEWFNNTAKDYIVRKPYDEVKQSVWTTQDRKKNAWTVDTWDSKIAYLQQFSGNLADINFRNDDVINEFKSILNTWRDKKMDGFVIGKASYLVEDLSQLMNRSATQNQAENVKVISKIVGIASPDLVLIELEGASSNTTEEFININMSPIVKFTDASSADKIRQSLEDVNRNPKAAIHLSKTPMPLDKARLVNLLVITSGSNALITHENAGDSKFLTTLINFQNNYPRGRNAKVTHFSNDNVVAALRSDGTEHLIVANFGDSSAIFNVAENFNVTKAKGEVELITPNSQLKLKDSTSDEITLPAKSGVVIKLEMPKESS